MIRSFDFDKLPIVEVVNEIILDAVKRGASDIHFDPMIDFMKVRIRIDGQLMDYATIPNTLKRNLITRVKIISGMNITEVRLPQDGAVQTMLKDVALDLRVSSLPTNEGEKIVIRILDFEMSLKGLEHLGFSENNFKKLIEMIAVPNGIILVTGATGSGKSTTVYAVLQRLNKEYTNVISVEDPVEMDLQGVNQVQVNSDIGLTFANVLRSVLRQDPNIIMIGEIRDTETARIAVRASITGHLVLSTLHTNNSLNTIERLLDMEVERYLLASALEGIVSQKLARRLHTKCRKLRPTNQYERDLFKTVLDLDIKEIYSAEGCEECSNGYRGRIAIHEVLLINQEIRDAIAEGVSKEKLRELVYKSDVTTLLQDGLEKVVNGYTTCEEVLKLIELDDDLEGKTKDYRYSLNTAIKESNISKESGGLHLSDEITLGTDEEQEEIEVLN
ncbi:MAG: GspE/PulE family protein [Bacilli bacterium]